MGESKRVNKQLIGTIVGLILLGAVTFIITFCVHSWQIDQEIERLAGAVDVTEEEDVVDISAIKIGYDGQTYTLDEFVELDEIPVVVDILIMDESGQLSTKPAYVSFDVDNTDSIQYVDGAYGRLILPERYNKG